MIRLLLTIGAIALLGLFALKLVFGILGPLVGLLLMLLALALKVALVGLVIYLILKVVSPSTASRFESRFRR